MRPFLTNRFVPQNFSVAAAHGQHEKLMSVRDRHTVVDAGRAVINRFLRFANWQRCLDKHAIAPDDWRGMSFARERNPPADVVGLAPLHWRLSEWRDAIGQRAAPLRPVA